MQTDPEATPEFSQLFVSSMTTDGFEGRKVAPHQYLLYSLLTNLLTVHLGWTGLVSSGSTVFLLLHLLQGRLFPLLRCHSTGGNGKTDGREPQKHKTSINLQEDVWYWMAQERSNWCLHLAFLFVKHNLLACCVFLRLKCAQRFLHNLLWIVLSTNIERQSLLFEPGILATSDTYLSKTHTKNGKACT